MDEHTANQGNLKAGGKSSAVHAVVVGVEADTRRSSMYRIAAVLENGGESELLLVHEDTMVAWRLLKGRRLTSEEWEGLKRTEQVEQAYRSALLLLDRKARTRKELEQALKRKGYEAEAIENCLERLAKQRLINDADYAIRFADQKIRNQRKGSRLVRQQLRTRGVGKQDVDEAISALDSDAERSAALELARKKWPSVKGEKRREREHKLLGMLLRRGYPTSIAVEAVRRAADEWEERNGESSSWNEEGDEWDYSLENSEDRFESD
ncbi:regulatory protein RecX [Cohnella sp. AR92]|uniref:regulatory protein RecX n=1 Tax=Cohnella sp. AR92 TaxID=648716 RepID=UPI000F8F3EC7|nr:RecX family transcriptional regulator [Cohnella sp. AR92]RUS48238.1 RecX family transcriptional regulator [Cohnella sp. AR92]